MATHTQSDWVSMMASRSLFIHTTLTERVLCAVRGWTQCASRTMYTCLSCPYMCASSITNGVYFVVIFIIIVCKHADSARWALGCVCAHVCVFLPIAQIAGPEIVMRNNNWSENKMYREYRVSEQCPMFTPVRFIYSGSHRVRSMI